MHSIPSKFHAKKLQEIKKPFCPPFNPELPAGLQNGFRLKLKKII